MNADVREPLTRRQTEVLSVIATYIRDHGYAPTLRELGALVGVRSTNAVSDLVRPLERKGYVRRDRMRSRGLVLVEGPPAAAEPHRVIALDDATAARCAALLHELLDGPRGEDLVLTAEHDRDLRALHAALTDSRATDAAHSPTTVHEGT